MRSIDNYDVYIFDCDGVILDSNNLKIEAMKQSIENCSYSFDSVNGCIDYFKMNFGKSRFHHVKYFVDNILKVEERNKEVEYEKIIAKYSQLCSRLYEKSDITPGFVKFLSTLTGDKYVASGSEQKELRNALSFKGLTPFFSEIYGSPTRKVDIVRDIVANNPHAKVVLFGDSISDFEAARDNNVDFYAYLEYSNVENQMKELSTVHHFPTIYDYGTMR